MDKLNEISTNRILKHLTDNKVCAIISPYRTERTESENRTLLQKLKSEVRKLRLGYTEFISRWVETNDTTNEPISSDERSLMIYGINLDDAMKLGKQYDQSSIVFKTEKKCTEICTNDFMSYDGKRFSVGQIVRTFDLTSKTPLNLSQAEDIFKLRVGGPVSMPIKSNRPFTLKEFLEVESPKASTFSSTEKYRK